MVICQLADVCVNLVNLTVYKLIGKNNVYHQIKVYLENVLRDMSQMSLKSDGC